MARRVYECTTYDTTSATCVEAVWVEVASFPEMPVSDAMQLLGASLMLFVVCWGWKRINRQVGPRG